MSFAAQFERDKPRRRMSNDGSTQTHWAGSPFLSVVIATIVMVLGVRWLIH